MLCQQFLRLQNEVVDEVGGFLGGETVGVSGGNAVSEGWLYQQWAPFLIGMIVGWGANNILVATLDNEQMAILNATDELDSIIAKMLVQIVNQYAGIVRFQIATIMRDNFAIVNRDNITTNSKVVVLHLIANRSSL